MLLIITGCSFSSPVETKDQPFIIQETEKQFLADYNTLTDPKGIMPTLLDIGRGNKNIILKIPNKYYEYFVYDRDTSLIVLSFNPFYYVKIKSRNISSYLDAEYTQFISNVRLAPADKEKSASPFFEKIGNIEIAVLFTPSQVNYANDIASGNKRIAIEGNDSILSPSDMLKTSPDSVFYTPKFEEQALYNSLSAQINSGMTRYIYTTDSAMFPPVYSEVPFNMNFSFMAFSPVETIPGVKPKRSDYNHCVLFTVPLGDSSSAGDKDYLNLCHGIVLIIKGDINDMTGFLESKGFDFVNPPPIFNKLYAHEDGNASPTVTLNWILNSNFKIEYRLRNKNPETSPDDWYIGWTTISESYTGVNFTHSGIERGFHYYYRITDTISGGIASTDFVVAKDPGITTQRNPVDGELQGDLAFSELCLLGSIEQTILSSGNVLYKPQPDAWFEIKNISERVVRLDKVDFYYTDTVPAAEIPSDIIFGPGCTKTGGGYLPVKEFIYPGEYYVISKSMDYICGEFFIYNIAQRNIPALPIPIINNTLKMKMQNLTIDFVDTQLNHGICSDEASQTIVYAKKPGTYLYDWINSRSSFKNINPFSAYSDFNNCTPGIKEEPDEY